MFNLLQICIYKNTQISRILLSVKHFKNQKTDEYRKRNLITYNLRWSND